MVCEIQICKHLRVAIYIYACTIDGPTQLRTHIKMVLVGQLKYETIFEEKAYDNIYIIGNRMYKIQSKTLNNT